MIVVYDHGTHKTETLWVRSKKYCPGCGSNKCWRADNGGCYYEGEEYCCLNCESSFTVPNFSTIPSDHAELAIKRLKMESE